MRPAVKGSDIRCERLFCSRTGLYVCCIVSSTSPVHVFVCGCLIGKFDFPCFVSDKDALNTFLEAVNFASIVNILRDKGVNLFSRSTISFVATL